MITVTMSELLACTLNNVYYETQTLKPCDAKLLHPKPQALNPKPTPNPKPQTLNPKPCLRFPDATPLPQSTSSCAGQREGQSSGQSAFSDWV